MAPANPGACLQAAALIGADTRGAGPDDAGELLAQAVIDVMKKVGMPNGLRAVGYTEADVPALVEGVLPQHRVTKLSPRPASRRRLPPVVPRFDDHLVRRVRRSGGGTAPRDGRRQHRRRRSRAERPSPCWAWCLVAFNQRPAVASVPPILHELGLGLTAQSITGHPPGALLRARRTRRALLCAGPSAGGGGVPPRGPTRRRRSQSGPRSWGGRSSRQPSSIGLCIANLNVLMPTFIKQRFPDRPGPMTSAYVASATLVRRSPRG